MDFDLQDTETETNGDRDLLLALHVEVPDDEPGENGKGEVGNDKPGYRLPVVSVVSRG
jgi:hypothetical protein